MPIDILMPLHPAYFEKLRAMQALNLPSLREIPVPALRNMYRNMQPERPDLEVAGITDHSIRADDREISIKIYRPTPEGDLPVILMFHGGGWVIGDLITADGQSREVCLGTGAIVVSVDYRLAPENSFPAAPEDCYAAVEWVNESIGDFGGDAQRIALIGDSAGGNLVAVVAQMCRDRSQPQLRCQAMLYPVTDGTRFDTNSYRENAEGFGLNLDDMKWFWDQYATEEERTNCYASPLLADSLKELPPALVVTAEYDVLRDEGAAYARRLEDAGVETQLIQCDGFIHGFFAETGTIEATRPIIRTVCDILKRYLR